jgi:hypothetical protein
VNLKKNRKGPNFYWYSHKPGHYCVPYLWFDFGKIKEERVSKPNFNYSYSYYYFQIGSRLFNKDSILEIGFTPNQKQYLRYCKQEWSDYYQFIKGALFK